MWFKYILPKRWCVCVVCKQKEILLSCLIILLVKWNLSYSRKKLWKPNGDFRGCVVNIKMASTLKICAFSILPLFRTVLILFEWKKLAHKSEQPPSPQATTSLTQKEKKNFFDVSYVVSYFLECQIYSLFSFKLWISYVGTSFYRPIRAMYIYPLLMLVNLSSAWLFTSSCHLFYLVFDIVIQISCTNFLLSFVN